MNTEATNSQLSLSTIHTNRSRIEAYQDCPRLRWLAYEWGRGLPIGLEGAPHVGGLSPARASRDLLIGTCCHMALAEWMQYAKGHEGALPEAGEAWPAVERALAEYGRVSQRGLAFAQGGAPEAYDFFVREGAALVEGLSWGAYLKLLPDMLQSYEVLEVEWEIEMPLGEVGGRPLQFNARPDGLLRDRATGDLVVLSWKTAGSWGRMQELEFRHDNQGLSEAVAAEWKLGRTIDGVLMVILVKGRKQADKTVQGKDVTYNPLVRCFRRAGVRGIIPEDSEPDAWAWANEVPKTNKQGEAYMGRLGAEWRAAHVWEVYPGGVKAWVEALAAGRVQPECGDPFEGVFVMPGVWVRSGRDMRDWRMEMEMQERKVAEDAEDARGMMTENDPELLAFMAANFRKRRKNCARYGGMCFMEQGCFGADFVLENPLENGFGLREPHHVQEMVEAEGGGE